MNALVLWSRELRVHQWSKNALLVLPLLAAHQIPDMAGALRLVLAIAAFCVAASALYIVNDLLDLESDRRHPRKSSRPFASGELPLWQGLMLAPCLLILSGAVGWVLGLGFFLALLSYVFLAFAYSLRLKVCALIDCFVLALLYTIRIIAGAVLFHHNLSFWMLAFSFFLFLSLAYVKRYAELMTFARLGKSSVLGRDYQVSDAALIQVFGIAAGYSSVLVLAFYLNSEAVKPLYRAPDIGWGAVLVLLFWLSWIWLQAHRGRMRDDPLVFALMDRVSWLSGMVFAVVIFVSAIGVNGWSGHFG